jgi:hypothetical protein
MTPLAYPCAPVAEIPESHYCRLCPCGSGQWPRHDEDQLADLAGRMRLLDEAGCNAEQTLNYRTPCLDLDLLYGKDPFAVPCIYDGEGRLKLGPTESLDELKSTGDDLPSAS